MNDINICQERILSENYRDFILANKIPPSIENIEVMQLCEQKMPYDYRCVYIDATIGGTLSIEEFYYNTIPKCYGLLDNQALNEAGISQMQNYPTLQLRGQNILIGFVDTGIDYENMAFRDVAGNSRIEAIWDQTIQDGTPPEGNRYGTEYTREMINQALRSESPSSIVASKDVNSHGTFIASVAAGSVNVEEQFSGAAPDARIAMVKLKEAKQYLREFYKISETVPCYQENDIILGIQYLKNLADKLDMPLVLCIALGCNLGSHTGISPLPNILNKYSDMPRMALVTGTGNSANERKHYLGKPNQENILVGNQENKITRREEVEIRVGDGVKGFVVELWTEIPNLLNVSVISPSGEVLPQLPLRKGSNGEYYFLFEKTKVYIDYRLLMEKSNSELVFFQFSNPVEGIWKIVVEQMQFVDGIFHMWITDSIFLTGEVFFLESNPDTTITEPANAAFPITVSYYDGIKNSIDIQAGRGYTREGRIKPDFAAPGVNIKGALPRGLYTTRTGSSVATAITAGATALLLEWNVYYLGQKNVSSIQLKNLLILGTERMQGVTYPNTMWGYGKLDLFNTFENIRRL
ncbi:MAG: S8 family peptidase [Eubacteriales bacterium]